MKNLSYHYINALFKNKFNNQKRYNNGQLFYSMKKDTDNISKTAERKKRLLRSIEYKKLKRIRKKTVPGYRFCKNCGCELKGMYCHQCGQYALDTEQPFWKYILQYFENVYQFQEQKKLLNLIF